MNYKYRIVELVNGNGDFCWRVKEKRWYGWSYIKDNTFLIDRVKEFTSEQRARDWIEWKMSDAKRNERKVVSETAL